MTIIAGHCPVSGQYSGELRSDQYSALSGQSTALHINHLTTSFITGGEQSMHRILMP